MKSSAVRAVLIGVFSAVLVAFVVVFALLPNTNTPKVSSLEPHQRITAFGIIPVVVSTIIGGKGGGIPAGTRWNQSRGRKTHGSHSYRVAGSMGACTYPGEVFKTKHLPGHMGRERITVQNLEVVRADAERNLLLIKGAIPGANGGLVLVKSTIK